MAELYKAPDEVQALLSSLKAANHNPRLLEASVVVIFDDSKPFKKDRLNWGKVLKFSPLARLFNTDHYDFAIQLPAMLFNDVLNYEQRKALLDLRLECCQVDYIPETKVEGNKKVVVTDEWGRTVYTEEMKRDENGVPCWKSVPLDLVTITANVRRFGCWCEDLVGLKEVMG